jgi:hypothetical protein
MKKYYSSIFLISLIILAFSFINSQPEKDITDLDYEKVFQNRYSIFSISLPDEMSFAGEKVPFEYFDVKESFDRELLVNTYWQSQTLLFVKRANKYFPIIEEILAKNNIPDDFKYIVLVESELRNVVSPSGAVGVWQLLKGTAKDYGLEVNSEIDERYHLEKSTEAACQFINDAHELFGSWTMAAAAYNVGRRGLMQQVNRQKQDNYYNLLLNEETGRYVYRILAIKLILENPDKYGFHVRKQDLYSSISTYDVEVDTSVSNFADFAEEFDINYKILKHFNPWLRDSFLTNKSGKKYYIRIPKEQRDFSTQIDTTNTN